MITELRQPLHMQTPKGPGRALFVIDYGCESPLEWIVFLDADGSCWSIPNPEVRLFWNWTAGRRAATPSPSAPAERPVPPVHVSTRKRKPLPSRSSDHWSR